IFYNPRAANCHCDGYGDSGYGSKYQNPNDYSSHVVGGGTLTAYMLVNNFSDLQLISSNLAGTYALSKDITAGTMTPIGSISSPFTGTLEGQGFAIKDAVI